MTLANVQIDAEHARILIRDDPEFLIHFFHGEELALSVPDFHVNGFNLMINNTVSRLAFALPRDHAKTTLAKLSAVWHFLFTGYKFIVYISDTEPVATAACRDIINWMTSDNFMRVFGQIRFHVERPGEGHYEFEYGGKYCILLARGAGQQVRGLNFHNTRPQLLICDDLETLKLMKSPTAFKDFKRWFYAELMRCIDAMMNKIIYIGNMVGSGCLLEELCKAPQWYSVKYSAILSNGMPLWPERWTLDKLKQLFKEYLAAGMLDSFYSELMNMPLSGVRKLIQPDQITYDSPKSPDQIEYGFIVIDPAISKKTWADQTGISVHGWTGERWQIVDIILAPHLGPLEMFKLTAMLAFKWGIRVIGIESNAFQAVLKPVFEIWAQWYHYEDLRFVPVYGADKKTQRLTSWCILLANGQYALNNNDFQLTTQLLNYDPMRERNDDDGIDSCAHGPQMIQLYQSQFIQKLKPTIIKINIPSVELSPI